MYNSIAWVGKGGKSLANKLRNCRCIHRYNLVALRCHISTQASIDMVRDQNFIYDTIDSPFKAATFVLTKMYYHDDIVIGEQAPLQKRKPLKIAEVLDTLRC